MPTRAMTAEEVAALTSQSETTLWRRVGAGTFPAPNRFVGKPLTPKWDAKVAKDPQRRTPTKTTTMTRDMHIEHLYDEVCFHVLKHGAEPIPQKAEGRKFGTRRFPLGSRVSALRAVHRAGRLSEDWISKFESLPGWTWDAHDARWRERFDSIVKAFPNLTVEQRVWLGNQRYRWPVLRQEWQQLLKDHPELLTPEDRSRSAEFVAAVEEWLKQNPGKNAGDISYRTMVTLDGEEYDLGKRVTYYRRRFRGAEGQSRNKLSAGEVKMIEALPGWQWAGSRSKRATK